MSLPTRHPPTSLLDAESDEARRRAALLETAEPVIERVLGAKLARTPFNDPDTRDDLRSEVIVRLVDRLQRPEDLAATAIESIRDYAAVAACHVCDDFFRVKYPVRTRLKNRIRYLLGHDARFAVWTAGRNLVGGMAGWQQRAAVVPPATSDLHPASRELGDVLALLFRAARGPVELDVVVDAVADLTGERDPAISGLRLADDSEDRSATAAERMENEEFLRRLWTEIRALPPRQRAALLLNLRDGHGDAVLHVFPLLGIASADHIGETLEIEPRRFQLLWTELPLDDERIAAMLGITRQQVVNLRKSARARLGRRLRP